MILGGLCTPSGQASQEIKLIRLIYSFAQKMVLKKPFISDTGEDSALHIHCEVSQEIALIELIP